ncbi:Fpg/Nei family DNA glycosylase [Aeromicrobium sp. YIM 150415]|uniref:DNA-formamidopyrimidine glycosylase family protein n=1 Tax=Aeromicrobium sp. YIM 150415 TaxID=2803912 RepID=UPI001962C209|nr:DNA-formamidopyrimidine glycosylase family protein [Aeromicrobium sp. YIM 150415]MBM9463139.1 Fpg/Nei family DNA glycosylase [Aeromicrobium sp. YIM 150415]
MPEGDTVWRTAHHLHAAFAGTELTVTDFRVPAYATVDLRGQRVEDVVSRGKHLLLRTPEYVVHSHLKMEGAWHLYRLPRPRWRRPAHSARAVLENADWQAVGFSLGLLEVLPRERELDAIGYLGPDLLGERFDVTDAVERLGRDPLRPVFLALLDQRNLAGLGNEYVNELLFMRRVAPTCPVGEVDDLTGLVALAQRVIGANARRVERSFTGSTRNGEERWVYRRAGLPCRRCGTPIAEGDYGDAPTRERICFWCPNCQAERDPHASVIE